MRTVWIATLVAAATVTLSLGVTTGVSAQNLKKLQDFKTTGASLDLETVELAP